MPRKKSSPGSLVPWLDPLNIDWQIRRRGRQVTIQALIPTEQGKEKVIMKITTDGAALLQDDLEDWTSVRSSVIWTFLDFAKPKSKQQFFMEQFRAGMRAYGPWIHAFSKRVTGTDSLNKEDDNLLKRVLAKAQHAGYDRSIFYSRHKSPKLLYWPLTAFLFEFCMGGVAWWGKANMKPPVKLMHEEMELRRSRALRHESGISGLFRRYLGRDWHRIIKQPATDIPSPLRRLLTS